MNAKKPKSEYLKQCFTAFILALLVISIITAATPAIRRQAMALIFPSALVSLSNGGRLDQQLPVLEFNAKLQKAAELKANDMAQKGYFSHNSPEGYTPWYWLDKVGYDYQSAGENLAVNFDQSSDVNNAWLNSPKHRQNILSKKYTQIGIAIAKGKYQEKETTFIVQFFGKPALSQNF